VEAGRTNVAMPTERSPGQGQAGSHHQPAQPIADPFADEVGAPPGVRAVEALPADPPSEWVAAAKPLSGPVSPLAASQIPVNQPVSPSRPEPLQPHPQPVPPRRSSGGPPPPLPTKESAREPRSSRAAAPPSAELPPTQPAYAPHPGHIESNGSMPDPRGDFAFDGNIAGPPYLALDEAASSRLQAGAAWRPAAARAAHRLAATSVGPLVEHLPRTMQVGKPKMVEVHIDKASVQALAESLQGSGTAYPHEVIITKAMSLRLRAPNGGFWIETASPETQWIENTLGPLTDEFASWRWTLAAQRRGRLQLQLIISARTVGADGLATETALHDQTIEVRATANYGQLAARWAGWLAAAVVGGVLARFGEVIWNVGRAALDRFSGV